jgi:hypothetical protein
MTPSIVIGDNQHFRWKILFLSFGKKANFTKLKDNEKRGQKRVKIKNRNTIMLYTSFFISEIRQNGYFSRIYNRYIKVYITGMLWIAEIMGLIRRLIF